MKQFVRSAAQLPPRHEEAAELPPASALAGSVCNRRRMLEAAAAAPLAQLASMPSSPAARAFTLDEVTPDVAKASALQPGEQAIIDVFENNTRSVANIFDLSLQGRTNPLQIVDIPEGNGSGCASRTRPQIWRAMHHVAPSHCLACSPHTPLSNHAPRTHHIPIAAAWLSAPRARMPHAARLHTADHASVTPAHPNTSFSNMN